MAIYVGYTQKRRTLRILNAGKTQYLLCPPSDIELAAELNDTTNLKNTQITWEQLSGPPVALASLDTLGTSFPFADTEDKKFRFWLDKDTNRAQYKDVDIFYTPTSIAPPRSAQSAKFEESMTIPNLAQQEGWIFDDADGTINTDVPVYPAQIITFDEVALSELLWKSIKFEILTDTGFVVDPEDIYATYHYAAGEYIYRIPLPDGVYRFRFYYDMGGFEPQVFTSPLVICNTPIPPDPARGTDDVHNLSYGHTHASELVELIRFTVERQSLDTIHPVPIAAAGIVGLGGHFVATGDPPPPSFFDLTPTYQDYLTNPDLNDSHSLYTIGTSKLEILTRLDPSNIGS